MAGGKKYPMSLSMSLDIKELLETSAKKKNISTSELVRQLIQMIGLGKDDIKTVVLKIPLNLLQNKESLEHWLETQKSTIVNKFFLSQ